MDFNEYQYLAMRTSPDDHDRILNGCLGLIGESGEIVDIVKKHMFQSTAGTPLPTDKLIEEMGDVMWYVAETVTGLGYTLKHALGTHRTPNVAGKDKLHECVATIACTAACTFTNFYLGKSNEEILERIADIYKALCVTCLVLGTTIDHVMDRNIEKLRKRYPDGFDPERSMNRPEYQSDKDREAADAARRLLETLDKSE